MFKSVLDKDRAPIALGSRTPIGFERPFSHPSSSKTLQIHKVLAAVFSSNGEKTALSKLRSTFETENFEEFFVYEVQTSLTPVKPKRRKITEIYGTKAVGVQFPSAIVLCDLNHKIVYMNQSAISHYEKYGGQALLGRSLMNCHNESSRYLIEKVIEWFKADTENNMIYTYRNDKENKDVYMVALRDDDKNLMGYYEKHEYRNTETALLYDFENSLI